MYKECKYNSVRDIKEVDQFGFVNLTDSVKNGFVPSNLESTAGQYNDIDSPDSILGKPSDQFEAMRMQDMLVKGVKDSKVKSSATSDKNE